MSAPGGPQLEKLLEKIATHLESMEKAGKDAGKAVDTVAKPATLAQTAELAHNLLGATTHVIGLGRQAVATAQHIAELAASTERTQTALTALGPVAAEVEAATAGMVTATQAYSMQQALVRSGLRVSGAELVTLTRGAREHARTFGLEMPEAMEALTRSIRNNGSGWHYPGTDIPNGP
jgi:hypothetical protein